MWPAERAEEIFAAWRDWTATVPDEVTSLCRIVNAPGGPVVRGRRGGDPRRRATSSTPLRALEPDRRHGRPDVPRRADRDPQRPEGAVPGMHRPPRCSAACPTRRSPTLVAHAEPALVAVELRHLGGALGPRRSVCHGALDRPAGRVLAVRGRDRRRTPRPRWPSTPRSTRLTEALAPWDAGRAILNFSDRPARFFDGHAAHRLRALKASAWTAMTCSSLRALGRRQRERQRLGVGAGAQRVGGADRLLERHRHDVVADRAGVGQQRRRAASRRPANAAFAAACSGAGSENAPLTRWPVCSERRVGDRQRRVARRSRSRSPSSTPCSPSRRPA